MDLIVMGIFELASFFFPVGFYSFLVLKGFYVYLMLGLEGLGLIPEGNSFFFFVITLIQSQKYLALISH